MIYSAHRYTDNEEDAVAAAVNAGVDVITDIAAVGQNRVSAMILAANAAGKIKNETIDRAAGNSLMARFRLGLFNPGLNPYAQLRFTDKRVADQTALALQAARESIVLLQKQPRAARLRLWPAAAAGSAPHQLHRHSGPQCRREFVWLLQPGTLRRWAAASAPALRCQPRSHAPGCPARAIGDRVQIRTAADTQGQLDAARASDLVIFVGGNDTRVDRAGADRQTLDLPYDQLGLLSQITRANPLTILVLTGGSAINLQDLKPKCPAIVMDWYNGEQGGNALGEVLLGVTNPSGRLPITFYRAIADLPPMDDYEVITGRTYLYCKKPVCFPFGQGLSYTSFAYDGLKISPPPTTAAADPDLARTFTLTFQLANTGSRAGDEVAQVYVRQVNPHIMRPLKQLVAMGACPWPPARRKRSPARFRSRGSPTGTMPTTAGSSIPVRMSSWSARRPTTSASAAYTTCPDGYFIGTACGKQRRARKEAFDSPIACCTLPHGRVSDFRLNYYMFLGVAIFFGMEFTL